VIDAVTTFAATKHVRETATEFAAEIGGPWSDLAGRSVTGYEVRFGRTDIGAAVRPVLPDGLGFVDDNVLGVYLHGLLEDPDVLEAITGQRQRRTLDDVFCGLADLVDEHLDLSRL
jgi:adenosylcobyric acid synthase